MFKKLFGKLPNEEPWPVGVPKLYPDLGPSELCEFLTEEEFRRIKRLPRLAICPFVSRETESQFDYLFGVGLSRWLIRNSMLLRNVSVLGPGDTPKVAREDMREYLEEADDRRSTIYMLGKFEYVDAFRLEFEFWRNGELMGRSKSQASDFHEFLLKCSTKIAKSLRGNVDDELLKKWQTSRPADPDSLVNLGELMVSFDSENRDQKNAAIKNYAAHDPAFGLLLTEGEGEGGDENNLPMLLRSFELDPFNAHTCFSLFISIWQSNGEYEPAAVQFLRRAIELSPGHGKAHMCAPHAAHEESRPKMITHSELGYVLLPGNSFAVNNFINNLVQRGDSSARVIELCREGIQMDPDSPGCHEQLINHLLEEKQFRNALEAAKVLRQLYEPEMNPRTLYSLKQNPRMASMIESGEYDPAKANRDFIKKLQAYCETNGI